MEQSLAGDENTKKIKDLEVELQLTTSEASRLQSALEDMKEWNDKLEQESMQFDYYRNKFNALYRLLFSYTIWQPFVHRHLYTTIIVVTAFNKILVDCNS